MRFFITLIIAFFTFLEASNIEIFATVKKVEGSGAFLIINDKTTAIKAGENITQKSSIIKTEKNSRVVLVWSDGSIIVVGENSKLNILDEININQENGETYYITKALKPLSSIRSNSFKIRSKTATIGVRGTEFIVNESDKTNVSLKEGRLLITSILEEFEIYKEKQQKEFEDFKRGFEEYKQKTMSEFNEYKERNWQFSHKSDQLNLKKNRTITIDGNKLYERDIDDGDLERFAEYRKIVRTIKQGDKR